MTDIYGKEVKVGDKVVLLLKEYGYRKLATASLVKATFKGKGQYGYEFRPVGERRWNISKRNPECVKV